jgi:hypothetical protein
MKGVKCRVRVYKGEFHRFFGAYSITCDEYRAYSITNTHVMVVVVRQNMCGGPVWTGIRDTSIIEVILLNPILYKQIETLVQETVMNV